jgi:Ca-activated chloride channel family protein
MTTIAAPESRHQRQRWLKLAALAAGILAIGGGGCAGPGGGTKQPSTTQVLENGVLTSVPNQMVILLVDISGSTRATDIEPTRLDAMVVAMRAFVERLPERFEVGVVAYSTTARIIQTPTRDRRLVFRALGYLGQEAATATGSGVAAAVRLAVDSLAQKGIRRAPGQYLPAVVVLASDGAQNRGAITPIEAAALAKAAGIRVNGIAVGTPGGKVSFGEGPSKVSVAVPPDPATVAQIARRSGGEAFNAPSAERLDAILNSLASSISQ